jgi:hypothetical protein
MVRIGLIQAAVVLAAGLVWAAGEPAPAGDGWKDLFNGKDLTGWQKADGSAPGAGWVVEDGAMVRKQKAGDIWTKDRFGDFVLDLEVKTQGNSGIFIRTDSPKDCVQTGIEIQVERRGGPGSKHGLGAAYDLLAPSKETGDKQGAEPAWHRVTITAKDNVLRVAVDGEQVIDMDLNKWTEGNKNPDGSKNKFRTALKDFKREGHIGFQDHGAAVMYRNVRIKTAK